VTDVNSIFLTGCFVRVDKGSCINPSLSIRSMARHILEFIIRLEPLKNPAHFFGKPCSVELGIVFYEESNLFKFFGSEFPSTITGHDIFGGLESFCLSIH